MNMYFFEISKLNLFFPACEFDEKEECYQGTQADQDLE